MSSNEHDVLLQREPPVPDSRDVPTLPELPQLKVPLPEDVGNNGTPFWHAYGTLDGFCSALYAYYSNHGLTNIVVQAVTQLVIALFSASFFALLTLYVNWGRVLQCASSSS